MVLSKKQIWFLILTLWVCSFSVRVVAQNACGTLLSDDQKTFEAGAADSITELFELNRTYLLAVYIVQDGQYETDLSPSEVNSAVNICNQAFDKIKVNFRISKWDTVENYHFNVVQDGLTLHQLSDRYVTAGMINLYLVSGLLNSEKKSVCAIGSYPSARQNLIYMRKDCLSGGQLAEQLGHFFNLYHTHETGFGNEFVDESNCSTAGDLCCDTPADPGLANNVDIDQCIYTGDDVDDKGSFYIPTTANFMSAAPDGCKCCFTDAQLLRMLNSMLRDRKELW